MCISARRGPHLSPERDNPRRTDREHVPQHHHPPRARATRNTQEIEAAARQYVRKISGVQKTSPATDAAFERAVLTITQASATLLRELPPRKQPPPTLPPLRRIALARAATVTAG